MAPVLLTWGMTNCCRACEVLAPKRPASSLFGAYTVLAVIVPHMFFAAVYSIISLQLYSQPWFQEPSPELTKHIMGTYGGIMKTGDNFFQGTMFPVVMTHHIFLGVAYSQ